MKAVARFCGRCGRPTTTEKRVRRDVALHGLLQSQRVAYAIATVFVGVIANLLIGWWLCEGELTASVVLVIFLLDVVIGVGALLWLGAGAFKQSLPLATAAKWVGLAIPVGAGAFVVAWVYVAAVRSLAGAGTGPPEQLDALHVFAAVILAPLIEEWLCRGVLWTAASRVSSPGRVVVLTAVLFAMMHGLQGFFLALPHRFLGGLGLGWLRLKSGSILPCIVAHATWNVLAVTL